MPGMAAQKAPFELLRAFVHHLEDEAGHSPVVTRRYRLWVGRWLSYLARRGCDPRQASEELAARWSASILDDPACGLVSRAHARTAVRAFYRWLVSTGQAPRQLFGRQKQRSRGPARPLISRERMRAVLEEAKRREDPRALRDAAVLLCAANVPLPALRQANLADLDWASGRLNVSSDGTARPLAPETMEALALWVERGRPQWANPEELALFVGAQGRRICVQSLYEALRRAARWAGPTEPTPSRAQVLPPPQPQRPPAPRPAAVLLGGKSALDAFGARAPNRRIVEAYLRYLRVIEGAHPRTVRKHAGYLALWREWCTQHRQSVLTTDRETITGWWEKVQTVPSWGPSSRAILLSVLRAFYRWARSEGYVQANPFELIRRPRVPMRFRPALSEEEMARLLAHLAQDTSPRGLTLLAIVATAYSTGLRIGAILGLDVGDIDLEAGIVWVVRDKGGKSHAKPLAPLARDAVATYLRSVRPLYANADDGPLFVSIHSRRLAYGVVWEALKRATSAVTTKPVALHTLRRTAATHMRRHGAELEEVQAFLDHEKLETTRRYLAHDPLELARAWGRTHPLAAGAAPQTIEELEQTAAVVLYGPSGASEARGDRAGIPHPITTGG